MSFDKLIMCKINRKIRQFWGLFTNPILDAGLGVIDQYFDYGDATYW